MLPYYFMVLVPVLVSLVQWRMRRDLRYAKTEKNLPIAVFFGIYFILLALRHETVGSDTGRYIDVFKMMPGTAWNRIFSVSSSDWGYYLLNKVASVFFRNEQLFLMLIAVITVAPLGYLYYKESEAPLLCMALFITFPVFMMNFSGLRQSIAIALTVPAFYMARDKRLLKFLLIVALAYLFHHSAIVILLIYPLFHAKIRPKHLLWLVPCYLLTLALNDRLFALILEFLGTVLGGDYLEYEMTETGAYTMIILMALFTVFAFFIPDEDQMDDTTRATRNMLVIALFIQMFTPISRLTMRMNYYFVLFIPLLIPKVINRCNRFDKRYLMIIRAVFFAFFAVYFFRKATTTDSLNIYPYIPFWG